MIAFTRGQPGESDNRIQSKNGQSIRVAVPASEQENQHVVRQILDHELGGLFGNGVS